MSKNSDGFKNKRGPELVNASVMLEKSQIEIARENDLNLSRLVRSLIKEFYIKEGLDHAAPETKKKTRTK